MAAQAHVTYLTHLNMCVVTRNPPAFTGIWVFMLTFDVSTMLLVVANAFHQPYKTNSQILSRLKRDAAWTFLRKTELVWRTSC
ncbi:hypothetical protein EIP86_006661 [Pleurotus ostreatoroseus]|nr:hypothetical protein EIP86_006661 [Pleurotus ostreatoroseus]